MKHCEKIIRSGWAFLASLAGAGLLSGCASDTLEHPSYWWNATVVSVERASDIPAGVDRACVGVQDNNADAGDRPVIVVLYRVGKASVTKAYVEKGSDQWIVGDTALVHPNTCRIKRAFVRTPRASSPEDAPK